MIISGVKERQVTNMASRYFIATTIVSGFPAIGKSFIAKKLPTIVRDLESSDFHWTLDGKGNKLPNPKWPENYIESIKALDKSGMYRSVCVAAHQDIREKMAAAGIKYTNVFPENTPEMKKLILDRCRTRGNSQEFINNLDKNWDSYIESMENDPGAAAIVKLTPETIEIWSTWMVMG